MNIEWQQIFNFYNSLNMVSIHDVNSLEFVKTYLIYYKKKAFSIHISINVVIMWKVSFCHWYLLLLYHTFKIPAINIFLPALEVNCKHYPPKDPDHTYSLIFLIPYKNYCQKFIIRSHLPSRTIHGLKR